MTSKRFGLPGSAVGSSADNATTSAAPPEALEPLPAGSEALAPDAGGLPPLEPSHDPDVPPKTIGARENYRRDTLCRRLLAAADVVAAALALIIGVVVLGGDEVTLALFVAIPVVVVVSKVIGLYDRDEQVLKKSTLDEAPALFEVATLYTLILWLAEDTFVKEGHTIAASNLGRAQVLGIWGLLFVSMLVARTGARRLARVVAGEEKCLVLGNAFAAEQVAKKFRMTPSLRAEVVGRVPLSETDLGRGGPTVLGELDSLDNVLQAHEIHRVVIAPSTSDPDRLLETIRLIKGRGVKVSVLPRLFEVLGSSVEFDDVEGLMMLGFPRFGLSRSSKVIKRVMDLVGSTIGLVVLSPFLAVIALAIKIDSGGPVFFRQTRIGGRGREFEMVKFRTMVEGADEQKDDLMELNEAEGLFKIADDPRVTMVGRILRRFSLDELPQLFNVLRGDMSLVGPRPLVLDDDQRVIGRHRSRLDVPPGMTGPWQVLGSSRVPLQDMVKIDYAYAANWSPWLDVKVLLQTVPHVLGRRGL